MIINTIVSSFWMFQFFKFLRNNSKIDKIKVCYGESKTLSNHKKIKINPLAWLSICILSIRWTRVLFWLNLSDFVMNLFSNSFQLSICPTVKWLNFLAYSNKTCCWILAATRYLKDILCAHHIIVCPKMFWCDGVPIPGIKGRKKLTKPYLT